MIEKELEKKEKEINTLNLQYSGLVKQSKKENSKLKEQNKELSVENINLKNEIADLHAHFLAIQKTYLLQMLKSLKIQ